MAAPILGLKESRPEIAGPVGIKLTRERPILNLPAAHRVLCLSNRDRNARIYPVCNEWRRSTGFSRLILFGEFRRPLGREWEAVMIGLQHRFQFSGDIPELFVIIGFTYGLKWDAIMSLASSKTNATKGRFLVSSQAHTTSARS